MFRERFQEILTALQVKPAQYARITRCDKSYVSRIFSGERMPKHGGSGAQRLVDGIYLCADETGRVAPLCDLIGCERRDSADGIKKRLMAWLYEGIEESGKAPSRREDVSYRVFGEKLDALMELTGMSNIRLGRLLNIDPSYISRFRNGFRSPRSNTRIMNDICLILLDRVYEQDKTTNLAKLTGLPAQDLSSREKAFDALYHWLFSTEGSDSTPLVEGLIDQIGSFSAQIKMPPLPFEQAADEAVLNENIPAYYGDEGLRRAVIRFLGNVIRRKSKELYLYSDQNINWMVGDPVFRARWATLMALCVAGGTRIHIIHNVNRDLAEMADAIKSWLPLYPSGMIRSYYCKARGGERFSTTLFLCPGYACVCGVNAVGATGKSGMYRYDTDPVQLAAHRAAYRQLLEQSGELAHAHNTADVARPGGDGISSYILLANRLSLATMPQELLVAALDRAGADDAVRARLLAIRQERAQLLAQAAGRGSVREYAPLPADEALFAGGVPMDLPGLTLAYTPAEYAAHIRAVIALGEEQTNYRFFVLPEAPFEEIDLFISGGVVAISRLKTPDVTLMFEHPDLCRAFVSYAERIGEQYKQDRLTAKHLLERYL